MNEFDLIERFFKSPAYARQDVLLGIGDDAACLELPPQTDLLVTTDTLVSGVHFLPTCDPYDIAYKAAAVNISDIAAMAGSPCWASLALTLPDVKDESWLQRFSQGLHDVLHHYHIALIGGDLTKGPLTITLTLHGLAPKGTLVKRSGACPGDRIYVSGALGGAALALSPWTKHVSTEHYDRLMQALQHPLPRVDLAYILRQYASAAIDISDGLSQDLNHICKASVVGAHVIFNAIPLHPVFLNNEFRALAEASTWLDFALYGGDDYELCFTVPPSKERAFLQSLSELGQSCFCIGQITADKTLQATTDEGRVIPLSARGYQHF